MKQITISGNLGANAIRRTSSDGHELMTFSVAVNDRKGVTWFNCVSNFRDKQFAYLERGQCVVVSGDLQLSTYNGSIDATINVDRVELCGSAKSDIKEDQEPL